MKLRTLLVFLAMCTLAANLPAAQIEVPDWLTTTRWGGDFRYRHESTDDQYHGDVRHRHRIRLRIWLTTQPNSRTTVGFRLASGGSSARSTNQSLSSGFSTKEIGLDRAWIELELRKSLRLIAGKAASPFAMASQLFWDSDVNLEGMTTVARFQPGSMHLNIIAGGYWLQEFRIADDQGLLAMQGVLGNETGETVWELALGYFDYQNLQGGPHITGAYGNTSLTRAPDNTPQPLYQSDYDILHFQGTAALTLRAGTRLQFYFEGVENTAISINRHGVLGGIRLKQKGSIPWSLDYNYREIEADALVASLGDSDFADGRTDSEGHTVTVSISPDDNLKLALTGFLCQVYYPEGKPDFSRLQADINVKF